MRKILLAMLAVLFSITLSYAESCSSGQGSLSYQISGCGEQSRACCVGVWCDWGTSVCSSCTETSESRNCSGNVSGACAGTQSRTRSVTGTCGSCSYSNWGSWSTSGCSYTQSCTETSESRNCSGNVTNACAGTQTRTRTVAGTCGSCSYSNWGSWSTSGCSYTQSCTATSESENRDCSGNVANACAGTQTRTRTRTVENDCGSCTYGAYSSWGAWTGSCTLTQSCTETSESRNCSVNVTNACAGTQTRTRTVSGTCGSCSYSNWGSWTGTCSYTQTCSDISKTETETRACSGNVSNACAGTQTRTRTCTRSASNSCGSCTYGSWSCGAWSDWSGSCSYTQSCTDLSQTVACSTLGGRNGNITETRTVTNDCGSCTYSGWTSSSSCRCTKEGGNWDSELLQCCGSSSGHYIYSWEYTGDKLSGGIGSCLALGECNASNVGTIIGYCRCSAEFSTILSPSGSGWRYCGWMHLNGLGECPKSFDCTSATVGQYDGEDCVCSCIEYGGSGSSGGCSNTIDCVGNEENACSGTITSNIITTPWGAEVITIGESATVTVKNCLYSQSCTDTTESRVCTGNVSGACGGVQTRTRSVSSSCGSCSYGSWSSWSTSGCYYEQTCNDVSKTINCSNVGGTSGTITATRSVNDSCGGCSYGNWVSSQSCSCASGIWDSVSLTCI